MTPRHGKIAFLIPVLLIAAQPACSPSTKPQAAPAVETGGRKLVEKLNITSPEIVSGGQIPDAFSAHGSNQTPHIRWSSGPRGTRSYVLAMEDPDAPGDHPFVHWVIIDIPGNVHDTSGEGKPQTNDGGSAGYYGPNPPPGPPHHYHVEVFALDVAHIDGGDFTEVQRQMTGHVLGKGELVALYQKP